MNLRPSGYEPDELPGCSTPRRWWCGVVWIRPGGPAATDSPAAWAAVPWALGRFTAEFGMGSGVSSPRWPPGHRAGSFRVVSGIGCVALGVGACARLGAACGAGPSRDPARGSGRSELVRAIRTARLRWLPNFHLRPIDVVVFHGPRGDLVSRGVSRLDAFSGYPVRAWLPGGAAGATTGAPEARPSRSSRTGDGASQVSCTHGR